MTTAAKSLGDRSDLVPVSRGAGIAAVFGPPTVRVRTTQAPRPTTPATIDWCFGCVFGNGCNKTVGGGKKVLGAHRLTA